METKREEEAEEEDDDDDDDTQKAAFICKVDVLSYLNSRFVNAWGQALHCLPPPGPNHHALTSFSFCVECVQTP